jgi:integrase
MATQHHNRNSLNKLTATFCDKVAGPGRYSDGGNLFLLVKPDGRKTWMFRFRDKVTSKRHDMGMGRYGKYDVTLREARTQAGEARALLRQHQNPIFERQRLLRDAQQAHANRITFKICRDRFIDANKAEWKNQKHTAQWTSTLDTYAKPILDMTVSDIGQDNVLRCIEPIWNTKTETATRVRQRIEKVLDWATVRKYRKGDNPARWKGHLDTLLPKPSKLKQVQHRPALPYVEVGQFMSELRKKNSLSSKALELLILTATRPNETFSARWDEFDLDGKRWVIPAERMKATKEHEIPLSDRAVEVLRSIPRVSGSDYVFPGTKLNKPMSTAAGMKVLKSLRPGFHQHGFRSTFRDWAAERTDHERLVIEHALAHQLKDKAEAAYHRSSMLPKRVKLMQSWADYCAVIPSTADNVSPIRGVQ